MVQSITISVLFFGLGLIGPVPLLQAGTDNQGLYAAVPEPDRHSLRARLEHMIALRKAGDWDELYEILDNQRHLTKEEFIRKAAGEPKLIEFVPSSVTYIPPSDSWAIHGCAVFDPAPRGRRNGVFSSIEARRGTNGWLLGDVAVVLLKDEPGGTRPCTLAQPGGVPAVPTRKQR
jgi:hypothetical protein